MPSKITVEDYTVSQLKISGFEEKDITALKRFGTIRTENGASILIVKEEDYDQLENKLLDLYGEEAFEMEEDYLCCYTGSICFIFIVFIFTLVGG